MYIGYPPCPTIAVIQPTEAQSRQSASPNWDPPLPHPQVSVSITPLVSGGGDTLDCGREGWGGGPNSDEGTDTVVL